jgi:hypothetical protein
MGLRDLVRSRRRTPIDEACQRAFDLVLGAEARAGREALYRELTGAGHLEAGVPAERFAAELRAAEIALGRRVLERLIPVAHSGANPVQRWLDQVGSRATDGDAGARLAELYRKVFDHAYESYYFALSNWVTLSLPEERLLARHLYIRLTERGPSTDRARAFMARVEQDFTRVRDRLMALFAGEVLAA